jgi:hypothetical protein
VQRTGLHRLFDFHQHHLGDLMRQHVAVFVGVAAKAFRDSLDLGLLGVDQRDALDDQRLQVLPDRLSLLGRLCSRRNC